MERSANGTTGYPPGSIAERRYREEMEQGFESMGAALDEIRAICRDVAGVDAGSATESVRAVAARARKWAEYEAAFGIRIDASSRPDSSVWGGTEGWKDLGPAVSQDEKPDPLDSMREAWVALQIAEAQLNVLILACADPGFKSGLSEVAHRIESVKRDLNRALSSAEDMAGIEPGEPD